MIEDALLYQSILVLLLFKAVSSIPKLGKNEFHVRFPK